jgi:hypothetical protein
MMVIALALAGVPAVRAQDTIPDDPVRAERLRQMIEDRFAERMAVELGLLEEQAAKTRVILASWAGKRRAMEREDRRLRLTLGGQMRPGIAANPDTVTRVVDALMAGRIAYAQTFRDELKELSPILTPIQRGQYILLRERLMQRVQEIRQQRTEGPAGRPRLRPPLRP